MDTVTFDPPGMPPSAILVVRRFTDPLPRRFMAHPEAVCSAPEWERAARDRLADAYRRAKRPVHDLVSASADAIWFADQAEMLACLACDLLSGRATLWWWKAILRTLPPGTVDALVAAWGREARYLPAVLSLLSQRGEAVRVLAALSPAQAWDIFEEVAREFELRLSSSTTPSSTEVGGLPSPRIPASAPLDGRQSGYPWDTRLSQKAPAPWLPKVSADLVPESLGRERCALLGMSLLLHRVPEAVRSVRFAAAFSAWYESWELNPQESPALSEKDTVTADLERSADPHMVGAPALLGGMEEESREIGGPTAAVSRDAGSVPPVAQAEARSDTASRENEPGADLSPAASFYADVPSPGEGRHQRTTPRPATRTRTPVVLSPLADGEPAQTPGQLRRISQPEDLDQQLLVDSSVFATLLRPAIGDEPVQTELGGVFFLVNLLRALRLPAILETEFGVEGINGWELMELLARCLIGPRHISLAQDPVWKALADLAGRSPDFTAGADFSGQQNYRLPQSWILDPDSPPLSLLGVRLRRQRLQMWHQEGFFLIDSIAEEAPSLRTAKVAAASWLNADSSVRWTAWRNVVRREHTACVPLDMRLNGDLRRFLVFLLPYVSWRLALALGLRRRRELTKTLLLRRARVFATATHVDVVMDLSLVTIPVRMSGLDADPGWVPDLGRVVKFNFTQEALA
ncbi:MAG: hypothetical protein LAN64_15140 [Acidobacteriia bacterium]|nr:hypothetical protein [Terriglobia bacterium]